MIPPGIDPDPNPARLQERAEAARIISPMLSPFEDFGTDEELRHLRQGTLPGEETDATITAFEVTCRGNAESVLSRAKEVVEIILQQTDAWPTDEEWMSLMPGWFVARCRTGGNDEWHGLTDEERRLLLHRVRASRWSVLEFTSLFHPDADRSWYWWNAEVQSAASIHAEVVGDDFLYASESYRFLWWTAGAIEVR